MLPNREKVRYEAGKRALGHVGLRDAHLSFEREVGFETKDGHRFS